MVTGNLAAHSAGSTFTSQTRSPSLAARPLAVSTSTTQIGVNVIHAAGTAWASGAITAASIATDAITAAKIAADAIGASELASDAEIENSLSIKLHKRFGFREIDRNVTFLKTLRSPTIQSSQARSTLGPRRSQKHNSQIFEV